MSGFKKRVAISGKMTSGKTTVSKYLIQRYGYERVSFATPIKWIVEVWFKEYSSRIETATPEQVLGMEEELYFYLVDVFLGDLSKASRATDLLIDEVLPPFYDIDWSVEKNSLWRKCLQDVGGGRLRSEIDDEVWINYLMSTLDPDGLYICDDLRYKNEYRLMTEHGFTPVRLQIDEKTQKERVLSNYGSDALERLTHSSEVDLDDVEFPFDIDATNDLIWVLHDVVSIAEGGKRNDEEKETQL